MRRSEKARRKRLGNNIPAVAHGAEDDTDAFIRSVEHSAKKIMSDMVSRKMRNLKGRGRSTASKKGSGEGLGSSAPSSLRGLPAISTAGATSFEKSLYSSPLAGASSKPALQREVARLMARNRRRDDKAAAKLVRGGKTPKKKRGERVPRGGAAAAAVMGEGGMYRAQDAEHALRTRRSVVAWMDPDAQTELDRGLRSSKMLREIAKPLAGAKGHGTEDASGRVWKKKVSSTQQGPTAWSSIELRLKYRDESGRNAAWQASVEAQAVAEKVLREEGRVLPVVEIVQHPLQLSTARGLAEENARSQERARLRNSRRFFNLDMRAVWQSHDRDRINVRPRKELVLEARGEMHIRQPGETRMPTPWKGIDTTSMDPWQVQSVRKQQSVQSAWRGYGEADIGVGEVDIGLEGELPPPAIAEWHRFGGGGTRVLLRADGTDDVVDLPPGCSAAVAAQLVQEHDAKLTARHRREGTFESKYLLVSVHLGRSRVRIVAIDPKDVETTAMGTAVVEDASGAWQAPEEGSQKGTAEEQLSPEELEALEVERALAEAMGSDSDDGEAEEKESANVIPVAEASGGGDGHGHGVYVPEVEPRLQWIGSYESVAWLLGLPEVPTVAATSKSYSAPLPGDNAEEFRIEQKGLLRRMQKGLLRRLELVPGNTSSKVVHQHVHADTAEPDVKTTPMLDGQLSAAERQAAKDGDKVVVRLDWLAPEKGVIVPASYTVRGGQDVTGDVPGITIIDNPHRWDADTRVHSEVFDGEQSEFEAKWIAAQDDAALRRARRQRWETTGPSSLKQQQQQATASGDQAEAGGAPAGAGGGGTASVTEEDEEDYDCSEEDEVRDSELSEDETEWDMGAEEKELSRAARRRRTRWERWRARTPDERLRRVLMRSKDMGETLRIQQRLETRRRHWIRKQRRHLLPSPIEELSRKVDREGMGKCDQVLPPGCNTAGHSTAVFIRDVRLSNSCSVLVLFSSYLERALQPPLALVLNRNAAHPQHAIHSHKFIETDRTKINLCENVWPSLVKQLTTETDSCVPTPLMLLSAAEDPMDWGPAFGHPATGHRREWNQRDAWGFRQRRDVKLLTPDGDVTSIFFGIRQPATLGSTPGVWPRRYAYHSTHAITIPRPSDRDEKVILRLATNYSWAGPNDPVVFTVRHETHGEGKMGRETIAELTPCSVLVNKVKFAERAARKRKEMEALALRINQGEDTRKQRKEAASKAARASHARDTEDRAGGGRKSQKATESAEWAVRIRDSHTVGRWRMWKQWVTPTGTIFFSRERKRGRRPQKTRPGDRMNPANRSQFDDGDPDDGDLNEEAYHCQWEQPRGWGTAVPDGEEWEDEDPEYALELDSGFHDGGADDGAETGKAPRLEDAKVSLATNGAPLNMENLAESLAANPAFLEMLGDKLDIPIAAAMRIRRAGRSVEERKADRKMLRHRGLEPNVGSTYAAVAPSFEVSQDVVARFGGGEQWWKARVARVHRDGTCDLLCVFLFAEREGGGEGGRRERISFSSHTASYRTVESARALSSDLSFSHHLSSLSLQTE